jgi:hypothetical protein
VMGALKRQAASVTDTMRRLMRRARNPLQAALKVIERFREMPDWAMPRKYQKRLAKDYTADVYRNNTSARVRMTGFFRDHGGLDRCHSARPLLGVADVMDALVVEDGVDLLPELINSEGYERLCRWGYGLEKVFELVTKEEEWKDPKKARTRWDLLSYYHVSDSQSDAVEAGEVDEEVQDSLKSEALFAKHLEKAGVGQGVRG